MRWASSYVYYSSKMGLDTGMFTNKSCFLTGNMKDNNMYGPLTWSLILFAISGIIGFIPLVFSVTLWHLSLTGKDAQVLRLRPWLIGVVIVGFVLVLAVMVYLIINRQLFLGPNT